MRLFLDESVLLRAVDQALSTNDTGLLASLGHYKAAVEDQISEKSSDLKKLALIFHSAAEFLRFSGVFDRFSASMEVPAQSDQRAEHNPYLDLANPRCACCGTQLEQADPFINLCLLCMNQALDRASVGALLQVVLEQIVTTSEFLAKAGWVVSRISLARSALISCIPKTFRGHGIAVCQRGFFTHHGTHPPENAALVRLGLFPGRVFQPRMAI